MTYTPPLVSALAAETLERANEALTADPQRRLYISHGEPPAPLEACDQLTVHLVTLRPKLLRDSQQVQTKAPLVAWIASLAIVRFNCVPVLEEDGGDPPVDELTAAHDALMDDAVAIARHLARLYARREFPSSVPTCGDVVWGSATPQSPLGGHASYRQTVDVQL